MDEISPASQSSSERIKLSKESRAGGPVTWVGLRPTGQESNGLACIWAIGPYLFRKYRGFTDKILVFPQEVGGTIHNVSFRDDEVLVGGNLSFWDAVVYGGRQLAICSVLKDVDKSLGTGRAKRFELSHDQVRKSHLVLSDWIWDVKIIRDIGAGNKNDTTKTQSSTATLALGMGRHTVELWSISSAHMPDENTLSVAKFRRISGSPSCLVMSMDLRQQGNQIWVAAGTAFQAIKVWSIKLDDELSRSYAKDDSSSCLRGHRGVIHSVEWSSNLRSIVSTSDDRSVRLWSCHSDNSLTTSTWSEKWVGWGHKARVWKACFAIVGVVSVAEDSTVHIWSIETGEILATIQHSTGLWSMSIWGDLAMVGATDGSTALYCLSRWIPDRLLEVIESIQIPDDRPSLEDNLCDAPLVETVGADDEKDGRTKKKKTKAKVQPQIIVGMLWLNVNEILVATRAGSLMILDVVSLVWHKCQSWWIKSLQQHGIAPSEGCCISICNGWVAVGTTRGDVVVLGLAREEGGLENRTYHLLSAQKLKSVQRLLWLPEHGILASFHVRDVALWKFSGIEEVQSRDDPSVILQLGNQSTPKCIAYDHGQNQALIGDMRGSLHLFQIPSEILVESRNVPVRACSMLFRIHMRAHVNSISVRGNRIRSVGNDGCIHTSYRRGCLLEAGFSVPVSSMTGVNAILAPSTAGEDLVVSGYYGNLHRIQNVNRGVMLFEMNTGGRQRLHDLHSQRLTDTTESTLYELAVCRSEADGRNNLAIHRQMHGSIGKKLPESDTYSTGVPVHGETIFDTCFLSLGHDNPISLLLTASEDCGSKIFCYVHGDIVQGMALTPQESCVRAICSSQIDGTSALVVVGGGKLMLQFFVVKLSKAVPSGMSLLEQIDVTFLGQGFQPKNQVSIDQRLNVIQALPLQVEDPERMHFVAGGDSAGKCHLDIISEDTSTRPTPSVIVEAGSRPILSMELLSLFGRILILLGNTAGEVMLFSLPASESELREALSVLASSPRWEPLAKFQAHQMGTNAMSMSVEVHDERSATVVVIGGGDDQALSICQFPLCFSDEAGLSFGSFSLRTNKHASFSAIKGVCVLSSRMSECCHFVSTGYTQRLALWKWQEEKLSLVKHLPVDIGDVNAMAVLQRENLVHVAIVGSGIELFRVVFEDDY